jgi:uncharacterized membrane protein
MTAIAPILQTVRPFVGPREGLLYASVVAGSIPVWPFAWHLSLHVFGAILLIGNALVMAVWLTLAGFVGNDEAKRRSARIVNRGDAWFTVPGVVLLLANGLAMVSARYGGFPAAFGVDWIVAGFGLLTATGIVWATRLLPTQLALHRLAIADGPLDRVAFGALLNRWYVWGVVATVMPVLAAFFMTTKPNLW